MNQDHLEFYKNDCESTRYQDTLMWNRFKTAATIEGLVLYGLFQLESPLGNWESLALMIVGFSLVLLIFLVAWRDNSCRKSHLNRLKMFEEANHYYEFIDKYPKILGGQVLMFTAMFIITISNLTILICKVYDVIFPA